MVGVRYICYVQHMGKYLVVIGLLIAAVGALWWLLGDRISGLGRLPGDIRVERENFTFYFPITTMILLSVVLSAVLWVIRRFFG